MYLLSILTLRRKVQYEGKGAVLEESDTATDSLRLPFESTNVKRKEITKSGEKKRQVQREGRWENVRIKKKEKIKEIS